MYYKEVYKGFLEIAPHDSCTIVSLFFSTFIFFCLHYTHLTPGSLLLDSQFLLLGPLGLPLSTPTIMQKLTFISKLWLYSLHCNAK